MKNATILNMHTAQTNGQNSCQLVHSIKALLLLLLLLYLYILGLKYCDSMVIYCLRLRVVDHIQSFGDKFDTP